MATYSELSTIRADARWGAYYDRVQEAVKISANSILNRQGGNPNQPNISWAQRALENPGSVTEELVNYIIAEDSAETIDTILTVSDADMQTKVDAGVDVLAQLDRSTA